MRRVMARTWLPWRERQIDRLCARVQWFGWGA